MKTSQLWELRDQVLTGKLDAVVIVAILDKVITQLEMANDAMLDAPCTCRPYGVENADGSRSNYKCLRCRALEEYKGPAAT